MIFKVDFGETIEDFAGSGAHISMWTVEFWEDVGYHERLHHGEDWTSFFGDYVAYRTDHAESCLFALGMFIVVRTMLARKICVYSDNVVLMNCRIPLKEDFWRFLARVMRKRLAAISGVRYSS